MSTAVLFSEDLKEASLREAETRQWFAAYTNSCHEKRVADHCRVRDIEAFLPVYQSTRRWKNGCTVNLERPLFPGYVFVKVDQKHRVRILELPGVISIVGAARQPIPLPDADIDALRSGIHLLHAEPHSFLRAGDRVKIRNGPLAGMTGILARKKNNLRVVLTLELIMKSISVEVDEQDLEAVGRDFLLSDGASCSHEFPAPRPKREDFESSLN
jgi:transcription antitermination factor NusG